MMRSVNRISFILNMLQKYWEQHSDFRLCQILTNINQVTEQLEDIFYLEDEHIVEGLNVLQKNIKK